MQIRDHVPIRDICWFHTGGVAEYFCDCINLSEVITALRHATQKQLPFRVLGHGSSSLLSDSGFAGLVIKNRSSAMMFLADRSQVMVDAGMPIAQLIAATLSRGYSGLEFLLGFPGTVGGAVYNNASAHGYSISEYVKSATVFVPKPNVTHVADLVDRVDRNWLGFTYRSTRIKEMQTNGDAGIPTILSVTFQLAKMTPESCLQRMKQYQPDNRKYPGMQEATLKVFDQLVLERRFGFGKSRGKEKEDLHLPKIHVTAGDVHKWQRPGVSVSSQDPNFLVNQGMGTSKEARALIEQMQEQVADKGQLTPLIEYVGLWD